MKVLADPVSGTTHFLVCRWPSPCILTWRRAEKEEAVRPLFPSMRVHSRYLITSQRSHLQILGTRFHIMNLGEGGHKHSVHSMWYMLLRWGGVGERDSLGVGSSQERLPGRCDASSETWNFSKCQPGRWASIKGKGRRWEHFMMENAPGGRTTPQSVQGPKATECRFGEL